MPYVNARDSGSEARFERVEHMERLDRAEVDAALARITAIAKVMDQLFVIPGTGLRLGVDAIIGLVPVVGDLISQGVSAYLIWEAKKLGVSKLTLWRMVANSLIDTAVGAVPIVGDAFDVAFRANMKNLRLLQRHLEKRGYQPVRPDGGAGSGPVIQGDYTRVA